MTPRQLLETHAKTSREALADGKPRPRLEAGAYLAGADLTDANLADANLAGADLTGANLADANLAGADRTSPPTSPYVERPRKSASERAAAYRARNPNVPVVDDLDRKILAAIDAGGGLRMASWHTCETTHCRAGWAITLAGDEGTALESRLGPERAGAAIYRASTGRVPHFFATDECALEDIKRCAELAELTS